MNLRKIIIGFIVVFAGVIIGLAPRFFNRKQGFASESPIAEWKTISLKDTEGKVTSLSGLKGDIFVVYFGFSHCPDMCPLAIEEIGSALKGLKDSSGRVRPVFISVDPERDSPEVLKKYVSTFPGNSLVALTGSKKDIDSLQLGFGVISKKVILPAKESGYGVDHTLLIYLVDKKGNILAAFPTGTNPEDLTKEIAAWMDKV
ncbi:SCO1/SenC [Leptospira inadai serovar Lyme str. 10]|uniref:SCO1/SenC n=2 Tax=Leptospira inadai serovar Lyme TaxID=293084 RepID=V6HBB2_9LEPT|nr:SCO family protein [Leptospira inadai]EQA36886.1 SCO1/SenC [Leptospira inadai serovar Lyme str. 10]PNV76485.1 photosynthetic protein synthase I [Leptospira inadai serovar Lyme]